MGCVVDESERVLLSTEANFRNGALLWTSSPPLRIAFFLPSTSHRANPFRTTSLAGTLMAAVRTMMSAVREEAAIVTQEIAATARAEAAQSIRAAEGEVLNPLAIRRAVQTTVQEGAAGEPSILAQHLSITRSLETANPASSLSSTLNISTHSESLITRTVEQDLGMSIKDALVNASQTGAEEDMDQVAEIAKQLVAKSGEAGSHGM
ncbi:hypothetical protein BD324DRAFT_624491 [Kockovaella imperatae]|uniref:Uncharacterized protein n=1 Tax=Kockovaella imperatae TaxID=4999 RepID=A0A1Y1UHQ3_9TREE|nr:hypothetical protein BD324DRAFT_624491 [Kockovaella imperatae]ORX37016.1 hypothetical protein BD324DRAFT_624491 [Kockovaella imperatae]